MTLILMVVILVLLLSITGVVRLPSDGPIEVAALIKLLLLILLVLLILRLMGLA